MRYRRRNQSPEEKLKRKLKKRVRNQARFFKHAIVYAVLFSVFILLAFFIREYDFVVSFGILFLGWLIGLIFHGLSAFVFNRINTWEETRYHQKLHRLHLKEDETEGFDLDSMGDDEDPMDLKSYGRLRKEMDERWGEGDFV